MSSSNVTVTVSDADIIRIIRRVVKPLPPLINPKSRLKSDLRMDCRELRDLSDAVETLLKDRSCMFVAGHGPSMLLEEQIRIVAVREHGKPKDPTIAQVTRATNELAEGASPC